MNRDHRRDYHRAWSQMTPPLKPDLAVVDAVKKEIANYPGRTLLLGVTPQLADDGHVENIDCEPRPQFPAQKSECGDVPLHLPASSDAPGEVDFVGDDQNGRCLHVANFLCFRGRQKIHGPLISSFRAAMRSPDPSLERLKFQIQELPRARQAWGMSSRPAEQQSWQRAWLRPQRLPLLPVWPPLVPASPRLPVLRQASPPEQLWRLARALPW